MQFHLTFFFKIRLNEWNILCLNMTIFVYGLYSDLLNYCFMHSENSRSIHFVIGQYICVMLWMYIATFNSIHFQIYRDITTSVT